MADLQDSNSTSVRDNALVEVVGADGTVIGNTGDKIKVDGSGVTQPVSASSLPLPAGASTSALQTTGNTSLASIDTKTPALGQALAAASTPVVLTAAQVTTLTPLSTVAATQSGTWTVQPGNTANTTAWKVDGSAVTQPISAAALPLPSGASTSANQTTGNASLASIDAGIPAALGAATTANSMPVTIASDQTVPVSAASLPLPSGAATSALQTTGNTSLSNIDTKTPALGQALAAASTPVVLTAAQVTTLTPPTKVGIVDPLGNQIDSIYSAGIYNLTTAIGATNYIASTANSSTVQLASGATFTGAIETAFNQQSYSILMTSDQPMIVTINQYIDLAGTFLSQTVSFTTVAGVGFSRSGVINGNYINCTVKNIGLSTTTTFNLNTAYGTIPSATALNNAPISINEISGLSTTPRPDGTLKIASDPTTMFYDGFETTLDTTSRWTTSGTAPSTALGNLSVSAGTTALAYSCVVSQPTMQLMGNMYAAYASSISVDSGLKTGNYRFFGLGTLAGLPTSTAPLTNAVGFEWGVTGVLSAAVWSNGTRVQSVSIASLQPLDGLTHRYTFYYRTTKAYFEIDGVLVATISNPSPAISILPVICLSINGAATVSPAAVAVASFVGVGDTAGNNKMISDGTYPWRRASVSAAGALSVNVSATPSTGAGSCFGSVSTNAATPFAIESTTYTEQTTNGQRSVASASASDAAAGTGARAVKINYYDQTGAGPFSETLTLNGTTGVNTVATNICFIESIVVTSVGSTASNVGIITLYSTINKGGTVIGTITATANQTFWAHHYVATGKTCYIRNLCFSSSSTASGNGGVFYLKSATPTVANSVSLQISDFNHLYGQDSGTTTRTFLSSISVAGPAKVTAFVTPDAGAGTVQYASFDYTDS